MTKDIGHTMFVIPSQYASYCLFKSDFRLPAEHRLRSLWVKYNVFDVVNTWRHYPDWLVRDVLKILRNYVEQLFNAVPLAGRNIEHA